MQNRTSSESWQKLLEMPRKTWWARLPFGARMTAGASAILVVAGGGTIVVAALIDDPVIVVADAGQDTPGAVATAPAPPSAASGLGEETGTEGPTSGRSTSSGGPASSGRTDPAPEPRQTSTPGAAPEDRGGAPVDRPAARPAVAIGPVVTVRTVSEKRRIPFRTRRVGDWHLDRGEERVQKPGSAGEKTLRYRVTYVDGRQTDRRLLKSEVTREPKYRIVAFGIPRGDDSGNGNPGDGNDNGDPGDGNGDHSGGNGDRGDHGGGDGNPGDDWNHGDDWNQGNDWNHGDGPNDDGGGPIGGDGPSGGDGPTGNDGDGPSGGEDRGDGFENIENRENGEGGGENSWPGSGECLPMGRDESCPAEADWTPGEDRRGGAGWQDGADWRGGAGWQDGADRRDGAGWQDSADWRGGAGWQDNADWRGGADREDCADWRDGAGWQEGAGWGADGAEGWREAGLRAEDAVLS